MNTPVLPRPGVRTLADRYCALHGIPREQFASTVLRAGLYPHARPAAALLRALRCARRFAADYDFVNEVGNLVRFRDFDLAVEQLNRHPSGGCWWRRWLRIRVSTRRVRWLLSDAFVRSELARVVAAPAACQPTASGSTIM